jgi:hypothetical protein
MRRRKAAGIVLLCRYIERSGTVSCGKRLNSLDCFIGKRRSRNDGLSLKYESDEPLGMLAGASGRRRRI